MLSPGATVDRYVVEAPLGEGGMAAVWRVRHATLGTLHALKVCHLRHPALRERFLREGRVQATLRHPNVVAVTDVLEVDGEPALVMEFVEGPSLHAWLAEGPRDLGVCERLFREVVAGVAAAHAQGLVHRDLKPGNVLLAKGAPTTGGDRPSAAGWVAKVADFGLVKLEGDDSGATRTGLPMGTPAFMAPEQIRDAKRVDQRADVFALGGVLYQLACGRPPFDGEDVVELLGNVKEGRYVPPEDVVPGLPRRFVRAIRAALEVDPDRRPRDCAALLAILDAEAPEDAVPEDVVPKDVVPKDVDPKDVPKDVATTDVAASTVAVPGPAEPTWAPAKSRSAWPLALLGVGGAGAAAAALAIVLLLGGLWWLQGATGASTADAASSSDPIHHPAPAPAPAPAPDTPTTTTSPSTSTSTSSGHTSTNDRPTVDASPGHDASTSPKSGGGKAGSTNGVDINWPTGVSIPDIPGVDIPGEKGHKGKPKKDR